MNICTSFTYKMAAKTSWHRYGTRLRHCHPVYTNTLLTTLFLGLPRWAGTRKVKPVWILLKQETVSGSGISWGICKSAPHSRQITMPAPHHSVFYRPDALPAAQPTASKHWRHKALKAQPQHLVKIFLYTCFDRPWTWAVNTGSVYWPQPTVPFSMPVEVKM